MFTAVDVEATKDYISPNDPDKGNPTIFKIGSIDPFIRSFIDGKVSVVEFNDKDKGGAKRAKINGTEYINLIFKYGLRGVDNLVDKNGKALVMNLGNHSIGCRAHPVVPDDFMINFCPELISEVAEQILAFQGLDKEETKN